MTNKRARDLRKGDKILDLGWEVNAVYLKDRSDEVIIGFSGLLYQLTLPSLIRVAVVEPTS